MFKLINMTKPNTHLAVRISNVNDDYTEFSLGPVISKRAVDELVPDVQYQLLNEYIAYKGDSFRGMLYDRIKSAELCIDGTCFIRGLSNQPSQPIHSILDMFDMLDVVRFVRDVYKITPPSNLNSSFNMQIESDGLGTRVQTYIQQDYYDLAALSLPIKAILGPLLHYGNVKDGNISNVHKEYVLFMLFSTHPIMTTPAVKKLLGWVAVLIASNVDKPELIAISVIEKQVPAEELANYVLSAVLIQKVGIAAIVCDDKAKNVITKIYNYIINKLKIKAGGNAKIRDKKPLGDVDGVNEDKESIVEAYRIVSNITPGIEVELSWYLGNINLLMRDNQYPVAVSDVEVFMECNQCFRELAISKEQVTLASYLTADMIDPRALDYVNIDSIINVLSVAGGVLWSMGHKELAVLLNAKYVTTTSDTLDVNSTPNIRLAPELRTALNKKYPYQKQLNKTKSISVIETAVSELTNKFFTRKWIPNMPERYLKEVYGDNHPTVLPTNLKDKLAMLIIDLKGE